MTERYFGKLGCDRGFLCLCQKLENDENAQLPGAFTDNMILRKIFIKDRPSKDYHEVFPRGMLLPELVNSAVQGQSMIVFPIHFKKIGSLDIWRWRSENRSGRLPLYRRI